MIFLSYRSLHSCFWRKKKTHVIRFSFLIQFQSCLAHVACNVAVSIFAFQARHRPVGLVVRRLPRERKVPGSNPAYAGIFSGSSHISDLKHWHSTGYPARRLAL